MASFLNSREENQCRRPCQEIGASVKKEITPEPIHDFKAADGNSANHRTPFDSHQDGTKDLNYDAKDPEFQRGPDGKIDWTHLSDLTGTRPNASKYSLERYSMDEWRKRNKDVLDPSVIHESNYVFYNSKSAINQAISTTDLKRHNTTNKLKDRAKDVYRWKLEYEKSCKAIAEEISLLENEAYRIKQAFQYLMITESITKECVDLRSNRRDNDLVHDFTEKELEEEEKVLKELRESFKDAMKKIEEQLVANKAAKQTVEYGWTDKVMAYNNSEVACLALTPKSNTVMFNLGAVRYAERNSTPEMYDAFCKETIRNVEATRQRSIDLRAEIKAMIQADAHKLKLQGDTTDMALAQTISYTKEACTKIKEAVNETLNKIADMETMIERLHSAILKMDAAMKLAQTRLDTRNRWRQNVENVRDQTQIGLVQEVKQIHDTATSLRGQLTNAHRTRHLLMEQRRQLEKELATKMQSIIIDKERCQSVRSHFPDIAVICGYGC